MEIKKVVNNINKGIYKVKSGYKKYTDPAHKIYNKAEKMVFKEPSSKGKSK